MQHLRYWLINLICTLLRAFPIPTKTGLRTVGHPGPDAPVFLTGNFLLTVERVKRALRGIDGYLLVADSRGINVWCGAAGGHLTNHSVVSVIKSSGIEQKVNHRKIILPQLSATGVETREITRRTGWHVVWGPVYASNIPAFLKNHQKKTPGMHCVSFPLIQRLEMAAMWAFPFSLLAGIFTYWLWRSFFLEIILLLWGIAGLIFLLFPVYAAHYTRKSKTISLSRFSVFFDFGKISLLLWVAFLLVMLMLTIFQENFSWAMFAQRGFVSLVIMSILSIDLLGSTPLFKSSLHEDKNFVVTLDAEKCHGARFCETVCPKNCFDFDDTSRKAKLSRMEDCVHCAACLVQCPFDALVFRAPEGERITPDIVRTYKLNLFGSRTISS